MPGLFVARIKPSSSKRRDFLRLFEGETAPIVSPHARPLASPGGGKAWAYVVHGPALSPSVRARLVDLMARECEIDPGKAGRLLDDPESGFILDAAECTVELGRHAPAPEGGR